MGNRKQPKGFPITASLHGVRSFKPPDFPGLPPVYGRPAPRRRGSGAAQRGQRHGKPSQAQARGEKWWLEDFFSIGKVTFQRRAVKNQGGIWLVSLLCRIHAAYLLLSILLFARTPNPRKMQVLNPQFNFNPYLEK